MNEQSTTHASVLVGMSENERNAAIDEHFNQFLAEDAHAKEHVAHMRLDNAISQCFLGGPTKSLSDELNRLDKESILQMMFPEDGTYSDEMFEAIHHLDDQPKEAVIDFVVDMYSSMLPSPEKLIASADTAQLNAIRALLNADAPLTFTNEDVEGGALDNLEVLDGVSTLYYDGSSFTLVMHDEMRQHLADVNFEEAEILARKFADAQHVAYVLTTFCGAVSLNCAYETFTRWYGADVLTLDQFNAAVESKLTSPERPYGDWYQDGKNYLVDHVIDEDLDDVHTKENAENAISYILEQQEKLGIPEFSSVLSSSDPVDYLASLPESIELRNWFDEHVPEGFDEYLFADDIVATAIESLLDEYEVDEVFDVLEDEIGYSPAASDRENIAAMIQAISLRIPRKNLAGRSLSEAK